MINRNLLLVAGLILALAVFGVTRPGMKFGDTSNSGTANSGTANSGAANSGTASSGTANSGAANLDKASSATSNSLQEPIIAWHFVLRPDAMKRAREMVDVAEAAGFNTVVVQIANGLALESFSWESKTFSWDGAEFSDWVQYAKSHGMAVVLEIKLLSKQKKFLRDSYPKLMFNAETYDPRKKEVYDLVFRVLDELIDIAEPAAIHIGHDELAGFRPYSVKKYLRPGEVMIPADLFLKDVLMLHDHLKARNVGTWMWGDMLVSAEEIPGVTEKRLRGTKPGYGKALRDQIPRDIVICDWHYKQDEPDYPTLSVMQQEGFRVIGATYQQENTIRNFSKYAAEHGAYGMMATTWGNVRLEKWDSVERILEFSGSTFRKDFADSR